MNSKPKLISLANLIIEYKIKIPEDKEESKSKKEYIIKVVEENINFLIKIKNKFCYLGYYEDE